MILRRGVICALNLAANQTESCFNIRMFSNVSIVGDGGMASFCAMLLCEKKLNVKMWGYDAEQLKQIAQAGENIKFLPGYKLPESLKFEPDDSNSISALNILPKKLVVSMEANYYEYSIYNRKCAACGTK